MNSIVILGVVAVLIIAFVAVYNGLIRSRVRVDEAWSDINIQLKRRYELIPNLVNTVKGYATHEAKVLESVTAARTAAMGAHGISHQAAAENQLASVLGGLFAVAENYPDLKANENFKHLQEELVDTEDKVQAARRFYNGVVRDYNIKMQVFPTSLIAGLLGFTHRDFFEVENQAQVEKPVEVKF